jgi:periplasmic divalent cation tolerance protein
MMVELCYAINTIGKEIWMLVTGVLDMDNSYCIILTAAGSQEEAERLSAMLVSQKLAACVQITTIKSTYIWQGALHQDPEWLLLIKTRADLYHSVEDALRTHHSYDIPEIIQVPILQGSADYLAWIDENTGGEG